jgi:hypothetical protein
MPVATFRMSLTCSSRSPLSFAAASCEPIYRPYAVLEVSGREIGLSVEEASNGILESEEDAERRRDDSSPARA